jgi:hypothetical protein
VRQEGKFSTPATTCSDNLMLVHYAVAARPTVLFRYFHHQSSERRSLQLCQKHIQQAISLLRSIPSLNSKTMVQRQTFTKLLMAMLLVFGRYGLVVSEPPQYKRLNAAAFIMYLKSSFFNSNYFMLTHEHGSCSSFLCIDLPHLPIYLFPSSPA